MNHASTPLSASFVLALGLASLASLPVALPGCGQARKGGDGPEARFIGPAKAQPGVNLLFDARDTEEGGLKMSHRFDFGDGSRSVVSFDGIAEHIFDEVGEFTVTLTVADDLGNEGSVSHNVQIVEDYEGCDGDVECGAEDTYCVDRECLIRPYNVASDGS